jgi:diadenosine tetraphosphate (Ap4A) HIT family hydrolase
MMRSVRLEPKDGEVYLGYLFLEVHRHIEGLGDMNEEEAVAVGKMLQRVSGILREHFDVDHVYSHVIGDHVPHLHIHIIPRYQGAPREFWGLKTDEWPEAPRGGREAVKEFCSKFRSYLDKEYI